MDRGGTITWYLTANDADFLATLRKARGEAKLAGADIDRSLNKGTKSASDSVKELSNSTNTASANLRNLTNETRASSGAFSEFDNGLRNIGGRTVNVSNGLSSITGQSNALRNSLNGLTNENKALSSSLGGAALRSFANSLGDTERNTKKAGQGVSTLSLSLKDFYQSLGRSANAFRSFQIALRGFQMTSLIVGATVAVGAVIELAGAVAALAGALYTVPAGIATFVGALSTIKIATSGIADSFKKLTKQTGGVSAAQNLAKKQSDLLKSSMKQDAALVRRLDDLNKDYADTLQELAEERMRVLNEQILRGVEAYRKISDAASEYLNISNSLTDQTEDVQEAQLALTNAIFDFGAGSQQAVKATRDLFAAQTKLALSTAKMDEEYANIKNSVRDLATNLNSLQKANRNEMKATLLSLQTMKLDKQARGESTAEIEDMVELLEGLIDIKDTKLTTNVDTAAAQDALNVLKSEFPEIAVAAKEAATGTEQSLTKSLANITDSMADVRRERAELAQELKDSLAEAASESAAGAAGEDPFAGLSKNARAFVIALKEVYDAFQPIKHTIQDRFFDGLDTEIRQLAKVTFPILEVGLGNIAGAMNGVIKEASRVIQQPFFTGAMAASMQNTADATNILKGAIEPIARVFTDLVNIGNPYVLMLADWVVKQTQLAAAFTGSAEGQNKIREAIDLSIVAFQQLGEFLGAVIGLFVDLFKVSQESGFSLIGTFTELINKMRDYIATEEGQQRMKALFEATNTIVMALAGAIGVFLNGILGLIEGYNNLSGPVKDFVTNLLVFSSIAGPVLGYISAIASSGILVGSAFKEIAQAADFLTGGKLLAGFQALTGQSSLLGKTFGLLARNPLFLVLGLLVGAITYLATQTTIFQDAWKELAPVFTETWTALQPLFDVLQQLAEVIGGALTTVMPVLVDIFAQVLIAILPLIPAILQLVTTLLPVFVQIIQSVIKAIQFLLPIVTTVAQILGVVLVAAINLVVGIIRIGIGIVQALASAFAAAWMAIAAVWQGVPGFFTGVWEGIKTAFAVVGQFFSSVFRGAWENVKNAWSAVGGFFNGIWNTITSIFNNIKNSIVGAFNNAVGFVRGIPGSILGALGNLGYLLWNAGSDMIRGLINGIASNSYAVVNKIREIASGALDTIKRFFGIRSPSRVMAQMGTYVMEGFDNGLQSMASTVVNSAESVADGVKGAFSGMQGEIGTMQSDFNVNGNSTLTSQFAPAMNDRNNVDSGINASAGVTINQTNQVYTEIDMDQVTRNLTWEMNKI